MDEDVTFLLQIFRKTTFPGPNDVLPRLERLLSRHSVQTLHRAIYGTLIHEIVESCRRNGDAQRRMSVTLTHARLFKP